ncbi:SH3 domain-containing protein [Streptomyces sp. HK10]|uniref:SH3 domain-containing protein n=1 Tax=Streptomyces sp. HK10 TaxID=3373255 RepID=UPI003749230C
MRTALKTTAAVGAAFLLSLGVTGATGAHAAEATQEATAAATPKVQTTPVKVQNTQVYAWLRANVRAQPNTSSEILSYVAPGYTYPAICWTYGETVTLEGYTNNKWVLIDRTWPKQNGYVTAIALSGDSTGGVPNKC